MAERLSLFSQKGQRELGISGRPGARDESSTGTLTPPPLPTRSAQDKTPSGVRTVSFAEPEKTPSEMGLEITYPATEVKPGSGLVPVVGQVRADAQAALGAKPATSRWAGPRESEPKPATSSVAAEVARITASLPAVPVPAHEASGAHRTLTPRHGTLSPGAARMAAAHAASASGYQRVQTPPSGVRATQALNALPDPSLPTLDDAHVEPVIDDDRDVYFCQDGTTRSGDDLRKAGYVLANGLLYSPGERKLGLHLPPPPDEHPRKVTATRLALSAKGPVREAFLALQDSRGRIFTTEQWAAVTQEKASVAKSATRAITRLTGLFSR